MKNHLLTLLAVSSLGLTAFADTGVEPAKSGGTNCAQVGTSNEPGRIEPATPPASDRTDTISKIPPTLDGAKPEGHGAASGPDVSVGQGGTTGPASTPNTGSSSTKYR